MPTRDAVPVRPALLLSAWLVAVWLATLAWSNWSLEPLGAPLPPAFLPLLLCSSAVALLLGFRAGHLAFVGCLVLLVLYFRHHCFPGSKHCRSCSLMVVEVNTTTR